MKKSNTRGRANQLLQPETPSSDHIDLAVVAVALLLTAYALATFHRSVQHVNSDITDFLLPWYNHILRYGRWASLEGSYANYSPPYLYLLSLFSLLNGVLRPLVIIKLVPLPFIVASAVLFACVCRRLGCSTRRAWLAAWVALVLPEVLQNTFDWGQCDIIHTTFLLLFLWLLLEDRSAWAMASLGIALSIKLQTVFIGPLVLALLLTMQIPAWTLLITATAYIAMMTPAALVGRPIRALVLVYSQQYDYYPAIAMDAANPYELLLHWTRSSAHLNAVAQRGAILLCGLFTVALVVFFVNRRPQLTGRTLLTAAALSLVLEPFLLPKMHDRYFFAGNTVAVLLALATPRLTLPAVLLQAAAVMAYYPFLHGELGRPLHFVAPALMVAVSLLILFLDLGFAHRESRAISSAA